jgi:hypothetical protein
MMEFSAGSIGVFFKAQTADLVKGIEDVNKRLDGFKHGVEALGAFEAFKKITESISACVEASSEAALNVRKLQAVVSSQADVGKFEELAVHLSHITTFSDDAALSALSLLGKFNLTDQQMASMLPKIADFAAFMGTDLPQAAEAAGRAVANGSGGLRGLGLSFTAAEKQAFDFATQQDRVAMLMDKLTNKFAGVAEAAAGTGAGAMKQFHNSTQELEETLGRLVDSPVSTFFGGLSGIVDGVTYAIEHMRSGLQTTLAVVAGTIGTLATLTTGTLALQAAFAFFGGLPAILSAVGGALSTVAVTLATVVLPVTLIASTLLMVEGMVSRIKSGNYSSKEDFGEGIKNNVKQGLADLQSLFIAPKTEAGKTTEGGFDNSTLANVTKLDFSKELSDATGNMTDAMKGIDTALANVSQKITKLDFSKELSDATDKDAMGNMSRSLGLDFSQHYDLSTGELFEGSALDTSKEHEAMQQQDAFAGINGELSTESAVTMSGGMSKAGVAARAEELKQSVSGVDLAVAGLKGAGMQLATKLGATGQVFGNVMAKMASGDPVGAIVGLGVEMLSRTKSFGTVVQTIEKIFTELSQVFEPLVEAVIPLLDIVAILVPVIVQLEPGIKLFGAAVKKIGEGLMVVLKGAMGFWNSLLDTLADFLGNIPAVGEDIAKWLRGAKIDIAQSTQAPLADAVDRVVKTTMDDFNSKVKDAAGALQEMNETTQNVPEGFKIAAQRFAAIQRDGKDPELPQKLEQILQQRNNPMAGMSIPNGKQVYAPGTLPADTSVRPDTTSMPGYALMAPAQVGSAAQPSGGLLGAIKAQVQGQMGSAINIQNVTVDTKNPQDFIKAMVAEQARANYVRTGKTVSGDSTRQYWGK